MGSENPEQQTIESLRMQRAMLADFGLFAFQCTDLDELLHRAVEIISDALGIKLVKVLEHRPDKKEMLIRSGVNWQPGVVGEVTLADHENSPGGYALMCGEPVVSRAVETENRFRIPQVLVEHGVKSMVNVIIAGTGRPYGVLEVDAHEHRDFGEDEIAFLKTYANLLAAAIERTKLDGERERYSREQSILARELAHRVRNVLGLVQALVSQTATAGRTVRDYRNVLLGRIQALAVSESLVFEDKGDSAEIGQIAAEILKPHREDRADAVVLEGKETRLSARKGRMFGLALHELATNSLKYGALSVQHGHVHLKWNTEHGEGSEQTTVIWEEVDGPATSPPERKGFGTRLLEDIMAEELGGSSELTFRRQGLLYRLTFPRR